MTNFVDLFKPDTTAMPFAADQLNSIVHATVSCGFVPCNYSALISTIKEINSAKEYEISLNADKIVKDNADPTKDINILLQVEGERINNVYNFHVNTDSDITTFDTYSSEFKSELYELKDKLIKKIICTYENINTWAINANAKISETMVTKLASDYELFKKYILNTKDVESFVESLSKESVDAYCKALSKLGEKILIKYKSEVLVHFKNITKLETTIKIKKPVIVKIYALSSVANACKRDWPRLNVISVDKTTFDTLSWYV